MKEQLESRSRNRTSVGLRTNSFRRGKLVVVEYALCPVGGKLTSRRLTTTKRREAISTAAQARARHEFKRVRFLESPDEEFTDCDLLILDDIDTWTSTKTAIILDQCGDAKIFATAQEFFGQKDWSRFK